ncbi:MULTISPECIES: hypothetical protein [unclassified Vibrio]|uniref:Uncharacterized protein n=1 Tax=Vibrio sp. HB236076 TaxID=3232307 RepID=A0AB39HFA6_9VIBR|nr:hypothetical protein [Vibrio sp. HB161653]MDP5254147.1 hypothetical protein [Vibrio sp. HB161653]
MSVWSFIGVLLVQVFIGGQLMMFSVFYFSAEHHPALTLAASQGLTYLSLSFAGSLVVSAIVSIYRYISTSGQMPYPIFYVSWFLLAALVVYWLVVTTFFRA